MKEYGLSVLDSGEALVAVVVGDSDAIYSPHDTPIVLDENLFRPVTEGFGVGEDARDVYGEAITWWDEELTRLEAVL